MVSTSLEERIQRSPLADEHDLGPRLLRHERVQAFRYGVVDYLPKPFTTAILVKKVAKLFETTIRAPKAFAETVSDRKDVVLFVICERHLFVARLVQEELLLSDDVRRFRGTLLQLFLVVEVITLRITMSRPSPIVS